MRFGTPWREKRERYRRMGDNEWLRWWAWYPVKVWPETTWAWLEWVEYHQPMRYDLPEYRIVK